jgi:hypothetical protein
MLILSPSAIAATRFYLPTTIEAAEISPSFDAGWLTTTEADRAKLVIIHKFYTPLTVKDGPSVASGNVLNRQYVSDPIIAQTIFGTVMGEIMGSSASGGQSTSAIIIKVVSGDGQYLRGTPLPLTWEVNDATNRYASAMENRYCPSVRNLVTVTAESGDRIVIEIGFNSKAANKIASQQFGDNAALDLPPGINTGGTTTMEGWIEFSQDFFGQSPSATIID